jgi:uncharacterized protein
MTDHSAKYPLTPHRCLADLKWLLQSAPLLSLQPKHFNAHVQQYDATHTNAIANWLSTVDTADLHRAVLDTTPKKNVPIRLGRYAETLLLYFLKHSPVFELIAANVPLRSNTLEADHKDHTTVGEIDYLLRDANGVYWHWELAVKFYLYCPSQDTQLNHAPIVANDFKGPAGVDTLALKLNKLFNKQLLHQPPPPYCPDISTIWHSAAYTRGYLFYPYTQFKYATIKRCDVLNPHHGQGWWLSIDDFDSTEHIGEYFVHLPRLYWLAPFNSNHGVNLNMVRSKQDISHQLRHLWHEADIKAGQLVAQVVQQSGEWVEKTRGFIMP